MKYLLDTSVIIDNLRGGSKWDYFFQHCDRDGEFYIPTIVLVELYSGTSTRKSANVKIMQATISKIKRILLTEKVAQTAGEIFRDGDKSLSMNDYIIAASALEIGATVVTLNQKHFRKIPGVRLYEF